MSAQTTASGGPIGQAQRQPVEADPELAAADRAVTEAEHALEDAADAGDAKGIGQAHTRLNAARARREQLHAARRGRARREQREAELAAARKQAEQRIAYRRNAAELIRRLATVLDAQRRLAEAREHVAALGPLPSWPDGESRWLDGLDRSEAREAARAALAAALAASRGEDVGDPLQVARRDRWTEEGPTGMLDGETGQPVMKTIRRESQPYTHRLLAEHGDDALEWLAAAIDALAQRERAEAAGAG